MFTCILRDIRIIRKTVRMFPALPRTDPCPSAHLDTADAYKRAQDLHSGTMYDTQNPERFSQGWGLAE